MAFTWRCHTGPVRVLVVDDDPGVRRAVGRALEFEGYDVDTVGDGEDAVFGDFVAGDEPLPEETVELNLRSEALRHALASLPQREREVVVMRYGLTGAEPQTLEEIGRRLGLTRERVRQIELESLRRLGSLREMQSVDVT